jgi:riboflavin biosynthesis pyrimidine reductase
MLHPVSTGPLADQDLDAAYPWPDGVPWLRVNMVSTADGAARSPDGLSHGISSDADRRLFGRMRGRADAVLAGASTVREEGYRPARPKPDFTPARAAAGQSPAPVIALVSRSLSLDLTSPLFTEADPRTIVLTCAASDPTTRARVGAVADVAVCGDADVDLREAVSALHARGLHHIQCEGGPHLLAELVAASVVDELLLTVSPLLAGGAYADRTDVTRILAGPPLPAAPLGIRLEHVLEDDGTLFLRYLLPRAG